MGFDIITMIFWTLVVLGGLIFVHELGHYLAAKISGIKVERFSIGYPPRAFGFQWGETDYCVSWVPLGGYCKMAGMIDESLDPKGIKARYVRFYSGGNTANDMNHYVEVEIYGQSLSNE